MKKVCLMLVLTLALMCMQGVIAGADAGDYTAGINSYANSTSDGARTVLIYKGGIADEITPDNIYYIAQNDSDYGFSNLEMMMKRDDLTEGDYTFVTDKDGKIANFTISKIQTVVLGYDVLKDLGAVKNKDGTYSAAFGISTKTVLKDDAKLSMIFGDNLYTTDLFGENSIIEWKFGPIVYRDTQGEQRTMFAVQIDGINPENVTVDENGNATPKFSLYLKN